MTSIYFFICIVYSMLISLFVNKKSGTVTVIFLFTVSSIFFINIGLFSLYLEHNTQIWTIKPVIVSSTGLLMVNISYLIFFLLRSKKNGPKKLRSQVIQKDKFIVIVILSIFVFSFVLLYFLMLGYIPLLEAIKDMFSQGMQRGTLNTYRISRDVYANVNAKYIPFQGLFEILRYFGLPVIIFLNLFYTKQHKVSYLLILIAILLLISSGQRWPLMYALMGIIIFYAYSLSNKTKLFKTIKSTVIISVCLGIVLSTILGRRTEENVSVFYNTLLGTLDLFNRIFLGNTLVPFMSYKVIPSEIEYFYGWTWIQNVLAYLPGPYPSFPVTFYKIIFGDTIGYTAPPDFYTEAFINFSWWGIIIIPVIWGWVIELFEQRLVSSNNIYTFSYLVLIAILLVFSSFSGISFMLGGIVVIIFIEIGRILIGIFIKR
jgi:oligosaccharide repeat unit polymerase